MDIVRRPKPSAHRTRRRSVPAATPVFLPPPFTEPPRKARRRRSWKRWIRHTTITLTLFVIAILGWLFWKVGNISERISVSDTEHGMSVFASVRSLGSLTKASLAPDTGVLRGFHDGRINVLLLGRAGEHHPGKNLTDTIMVMSIDTRENRVGLLSLPRDLYARIQDTQTYTKINSLYQIGIGSGEGVGLTRDAVSDITGLPIHYFVIVNFDAFEKVVDTLGGIGVYSERDIHDPRYPGPNYSYETFDLKKGWQILDGATALKYVRERHDDPEGDFGRAKRQQQVLQAVKEQAFSIGTLTNPFTINALLDTLGDNVETDITPGEIPAFLALSRTVDTHNIANAVVDAWKPDSLLRVSHVMVGPTAMFILVPRVGNWNEVRDLADNLFDQEALKRQADGIAEERASVSVENRSGHPDYADRLVRLLRDQIGFRAVSVVPTTASSVADTSRIIDYTSGQKPWSLNAILKKLPTALDDQAIDPESFDGADLRIIAGKDMEDVFRYEEASQEDYRKDQDETGYGEFLPPTGP